MKNADGSHSHTPIDHNPLIDVPPQTGEVESTILPRHVENVIEHAVRAKLERIATARGVSIFKAVPFLIAELRA